MERVRGHGQDQAMPREIALSDTLSLSLLTPEDAQRIAEIFDADPSIQRRVTWAHGLEDVDAIAARIERFQQNGSLRYGIRQDGRLIGYVGMWKDEGYMEGVATEGQYGFGYFLDPASRGKGTMVAAVEKLMETAEGVFDVEVWAAYCEDDNSASQGVLKKLGFTRTKMVFDEPTMHTAERRWER